MSERSFTANVSERGVVYGSKNNPFQKVEYSEILQAMKQAWAVDVAANVLLIIGAVFLLAFVSNQVINWLIIGLIGAVVGAALKFLARVKLPVHLEYSFEGGIYNSQMFDAWRAFLSSATVWEITDETAIANQKTNSGADHGFQRFEVKRPQKTPFYIVSNSPALYVKLKSKRILFLPGNSIITQKGSKFGMVEYFAGQVKAYKERFVESGVVPTDAEVVGQTYKYVNKDGSPDGRYNDNPTYSVCLYGYVEIIGSEIKLSCSNSEGVNGFNSD